MSDEAIMENYENIQDLLMKINMLDARILKLETLIVKLCNEEPDSLDEFLVNAEHLCEDESHYSIEDLAEIALEKRANEDRGEDR